MHEESALAVDQDPELNNFLSDNFSRDFFEFLFSPVGYRHKPEMTLADFNVCAPFFAMVYNDGAFCAGPLVEQVKSALQNDMPHLKRYLETTMKNELQAKYLNKRPSRPF